MQTQTLNAACCVQDRCVVNAPVTPRKSLWRQILNILRPRHYIPHARDLSDHMARDIGLSPAEMERHRLTLPSQSTFHPRG
ncbi:hypothetical protein [uncultured Roseobacter sp.]|uniref:hypothetical protein n=1 Tax=uncultured Roseobacter sp. TaxID=114847 RepID=UPI0026093A40|nr:hypothetical protein [uncultured Roseobacter sp.]